MKKIILLLCFFLSVSTLSFGQMYYKKCWFAEAGFGLGIQHYQFTDITNNQTDPRDTSAAYEVPFRFEYAALNWFGVSLDGNFASYITANSSKNESAKGIDFVPTANIHAPFKMNHLDLSGTLGYGYSHFSYKVNDVNGGKAVANGWVLNWGINLRFLFKRDGHFGMGLWYKHSLYNYNKGTINDNAGNKTSFKLDGPGNNFGVGFFYRMPGL
ncbi:MAG TPA: hypothetical protein VFJ43_11440 [Bacteroidia bacterium]|nr:hypothetical protein [Bacteroidia bacterium]